ncbi:hypothetical protein A2773_06765 [Candidatus Gottesmanbacteria bacterium RIFCSPHIGHO2_01_FULL_39_10]|uniref:Uncharacterized protein n=1 Tax=Candidatus Gottesmanbacteria bacterium RIFCSPHIGHO2_01_FULL_39_10 TaxID=1798375 RepID=A0A1F5ZPF1_9BACT|nr:MAG: hypothetical protein A2773_06765 [Candidatus Gottesmanbacteria bacterium RIFCSPHIGHO2_01_FULL_39_10]
MSTVSSSSEGAVRIEIAEDISYQVKILSGGVIRLEPEQGGRRTREGRKWGSNWPMDPIGDGKISEPQKITKGLPLVIYGSELNWTSGSEIKRIQIYRNGGWQDRDSWSPSDM